MEHYAHMLPEEMLYIYLDGELDVEYDEVLFTHLAASSDLRAEMRDLLAIRHGVQKDVLLPDPAVKAGILAALPAEAAMEAAVGSAAVAAGRSSFSLFSHVALPLCSAVVGAVVMFLALSWSNALPGGKTAVLSGSGTAAMTERAPVESRAQTPSGYRQENGGIAEHNAGTVHNSFAVAAARNRENRRLSAIDNSSADPLANDIPDPSATDTQSDALSATDNSVVLVTAVDLKESVMQTMPQYDTPDLPAQVVSHVALPEPITPRMQLRIRSIAAESFPKVDVGSTTPMFGENMSAGIHYLLSSAHSIGFEIGREKFAQVFTDAENGHTFRYTQSPVLTWGGLSYSFRPDLFGEGTPVRPFADGVLGMALPGFPLSRTTLGIEFTPETRMSMSFGVEGALLLYRHDDIWFTTRKLGFTYGLSYRF